MKSDIQFAYAAGILDGEGCFSVVHDKKKGNSFRPCVQVVMTDLKPLRRLQGLFGGSLVETKMSPGGRKTPYHFTASGKNARHLIESTLPLLIEKKDQAKILLELQNNIDEWNSKPRLRGNLPSDVVEYRMSLKQRAHQLKNENASMPSGRTQAKRERLSYLAGLLEAEGCFTIIRGDGNYFASTVSVMMCNRAVLEEVVSMFGGTIIERKQANGRTILMWRVKGQAAADLCRSIAPYVAFRHEELELLRNLQNTTNLWAKRVGRGGMPEHVTAKRVAWMQRIREIHRPARAETKSEQPQSVVSDSPICPELSGAGTLQSAVA